MQGDVQNTSVAAAGAVASGQQNGTMFAIILIILAAGAFGGWAAYLAQPQTDPKTNAPIARARWLVFLTLGIVAAGCVPLFLSILKSELVRGIFNKPSMPDSYDSYLIFAGLCLVAAFSARRFIETITEQLLRKVDQAQRDAAEARTEAAEAAVVAHEAINEIEAADEIEGGRLPEPQGAVADEDESLPVGQVRLTLDERRVLHALENKTYRTASGIAEDSGVPRHRISEMLEALADKKLIVPTKSPRSGGARWAISRRGTALLRQG